MLWVFPSPHPDIASNRWPAPLWLRLPSEYGSLSSAFWNDHFASRRACNTMPSDPEQAGEGVDFKKGSLQLHRGPKHFLMDRHTFKSLICLKILL